jgi:hypothetical protein
VETNLEYEEYKGTGEVNSSFSYVLFMIFPILALFAGGIFYRKQNPEISISSFLSGAIGIGLIYSLLLSIFSLFSGFDYDLNLSESGESVLFNLSASYPFFQTFLKALLIGTVFSFLGMLFSINFRQMTIHLEHLIPYGNAVHQGFAAFTRGFITLSIIIITFLAIKLNEWKSSLEWIDVLDVPGLSQLLEKTTWAAGYLGVQLSSLIYSMLHFSPLSFTLEGDGESGGIDYSIFSGFTYLGDAVTEDMSSLEYFFSSYDIDLYLQLAVLIPVLLLLFAGYSMAKSNQSSFKSLAIFSLVYSLFAVSLAAVCAVHVDGMVDIIGESKTILNFSVATSTFKVFIGSFILAYIAGFAGSYLTKFFPGAGK